MNGSILFIVQPSTGHINASLNIAKLFRSAKYRVAYTGHESGRCAIEKEGIKYFKLESLPFGCGHEKFIRNEKGENTYLDNLLLRLSDKLYSERKKDLNTVFAVFNPDYIFIDPFFSTDFIILFDQLALKRVKIFFLQTMLPTVKADFFPPLSSTQIPLQNIHSRVMINLSWKIKALHFNIWRCREWCKFFGRDDVSIVKKKIKLHQIPRSMHLEDTIFINYSFKSIPEIILAPQELEFSKLKARTNHFYVGSLINKERKEADLDRQHEDILKYILHCKQSEPKTSIIYCSFGSRYTMYYVQLKFFFERLFKIISKYTNYLTVVSMNKDLHNEFKKVPSNIFIMNKVDQMSILNLSDLFITHGGLNSVKESIHFEVPMLVYPLELYGDQPGNAARVSYHKLGLLGDLKNDSQNLMEQMINEIIMNHEFRKNMMNFNTKLKEKYTLHNFISSFHNISSNYFRLLSF